MGCILDFLQSAVDLGQIKGQLSAFNSSFSETDCFTFLGACLLCKLSRVLFHKSGLLGTSTWKFLYCKMPSFEPIYISLVLLTQKVIFLVVITPTRRVLELAALFCKELFLVLHHDKVVLRPLPSFLPKNLLWMDAWI